MVCVWCVCGVCVVCVVCVHKHYKDIYPMLFGSMARGFGLHLLIEYLSQKSVSFLHTM